MLFIKICVRNIHYVIEERAVKIKWQIKILKLIRIMGIVKFIRFITKSQVRAISVFNTHLELCTILNRKGQLEIINYQTGEIKTLDNKELMEFLGLTPEDFEKRTNHY